MLWAAKLDGQWREAYDGARAPYAYTPAAKGLRRLRNVALGYIAASGAEGEGVGVLYTSHGSIKTRQNQESLHEK